MATNQKKPFAQVVWDTLNGIDCSAFTEKKKATGGRELTYLSWAGAWEILMHHFPCSSFSFREPVFYQDGTCELWCTVIVSDGTDSLERTCFLPVMTGFQNSAKPNPDARDIGDSRMRCLVKALGLCGLGLYIYRGEDIPTYETTDKPAASQPKGDPKGSSWSHPKAQANGKATPPPRPPAAGGKHPDKPIHPDTEKWINEAILMLCDGDEEVAGVKVHNLIVHTNENRAKSGSSEEVAKKLGDLIEVEGQRIVKGLKVRLHQKSAEQKAAAANEA